MNNCYRGNNKTFNCNNSSIMGNNNHIIGDNNTIMGHGNTINGNDNRISGTDNRCQGSNNIQLWNLLGNEKQYRTNKIANGHQNNFYRPNTNSVKVIKVPDEYPEEEKVNEENDLCSICMERKIVTVIVDCGHRCLCVTCSRTYQNHDNPQCPICRKNITHIIKTY